MTIKSPLQISDRKTRVFLSYSRKDIEFAQLLKTELEAQGFHPMLDKTDIAPGENWQDRLSKLIIEADAVVFSVSPNSAASKICGWEISEAERLGKRIIPVVVDPVDTGLLPEALTRLNFIFFADVSFEDGLAKLNSALNTDLDWVRQHTRLGEQAIEWQARKKSGARLLTGDALRQAEGWLINQPRDASPPTDLQKQFILASRQSINRFQRWSLIGAIAVAMFAIALVIWGLINQFEKDEALQSAENTIEVALQSSKSLLEQTISGELQSLSTPVKQKLLAIALSVPNDLKISGVINPNLKMVLANLKSEMSPLLLGLSQSSEALNYAQQGASDLQQQLEIESSTLDLAQSLKLRDYLSVAYNRLFSIQLATNKFAEAVETAGAELKLAEDTLRLIPGSVDWQATVGEWDASVATAYIDRGQANRELDSAKAVADLDIAKIKLDELDKNNPGSDEIKVNRGVAYQLLGNLKYAANNYAEALAFYEIDFEISKFFYDRNTKDAGSKRKMAIAEQNLGRSYMQLENFDLALEHFTKFYDLTNSLLDNDLENAVARNNFSAANNMLGTLYLKKNEPEKAVPYFKEDLIQTKILADADKDNDAMKINLAKSYFNLANIGSEQRENYTQAMAILNEFVVKGTLPASAQDLKDLVEQGLAALP